MFKLLFLTLLLSLASLEARELFTSKEREELKFLKSSEFTHMNFVAAIKKSNLNNLRIILKQMSQKDKELLDHQLKNKPWAKLDENDTRQFMNKWIMKELLMDRMNRKN